MLRIMLIIIGSLMSVQGIWNGVHEDIAIHNAYTAAILRRHWDTERFQHYCSGAIISELYILTTASCSGNDFRDVGVRVGSSYRDTGGLLYRVANIYQHPKFTPDFDYDIALLKLSDTLKFSHRVAVVKLPNPNASLNDNQDVKISGWGYTSLTDSLDNHLAVGYISMVDTEECSTNYTRYYHSKLITDRMICADGPSRPCERDQGAPLVYVSFPNMVSTLYGIFSWSFGCFSLQFPPVFTSVSVFRTWIDIYMK